MKLQIIFLIHPRGEDYVKDSLLVDTNGHSHEIIRTPVSYVYRSCKGSRSLYCPSIEGDKIVRFADKSTEPEGRNTEKKSMFKVVNEFTRGCWQDLNPFY